MAYMEERDGEYPCLVFQSHSRLTWCTCVAGSCMHAPGRIVLLDKKRESVVHELFGKQLLVMAYLGREIFGYVDKIVLAGPLNHIALEALLWTLCGPKWPICQQSKGLDRNACKVTTWVVPNPNTTSKLNLLRADLDSSQTQVGK